MDVVSPRLNILGWVWIAWSAIFVLLGVAVGLGALGFAGLVGFLPDSNTGEPPPLWVPAIFGGLGLTVGALFVGFGVLGMVAGQYTRRGKTWAKFVLMFLALGQLSSFPLGTALGIGTFVVLFLPEDKRGASGS